MARTKKKLNLGQVSVSLPPIGISPDGKNQLLELCKEVGKPALFAKPKVRIKEKRVKVRADKLVELATRGLGVSELAQYFGVATSSISERLQRLGLTREKLAGYRAFRNDPAKQYELVEYSLLDSLNVETIKQMSGYQRLVGAGICRDKILSMRGGSILSLADLIMEAFQMRVQRLTGAKQEAGEADRKSKEAEGQIVG